MKTSDLEVGKCYVEIINGKETSGRVVMYIGHTAGWKVLEHARVQYMFASVKHGSVHSHTDLYFEDYDTGGFKDLISFRVATPEEINEAIKSYESMLKPTPL